MSTLDFDSLLKPISDSAPSGEDLEYDPQFVELERAAEGKPEQQIGETVIPAEEPDWKQVRKLCLELLKNTRDLRLAAYLAKASLATEGWSGFRDGLSLMKGFLTDFWESVHPQLDPDDDNDPTFRVNSLVSLCDGLTTLQLCKKTPLVQSQVVGKFSLRDVAIADGDLPPPEEGEAPTHAIIDAAFNEVPVEQIEQTSAAVAESIQLTKDLEEALTQQVGAANSVQLKPLLDVLQTTSKFIEPKLKQRLAAAGPSVFEEGPGPEQAAAASGNGAVPSDQLSGRIRTREDVLKALDLICEYYDLCEPSSPLPLLLKRCKRLATASFMDIIRDLAPGGLEEVHALSGPGENSEQNQQSAKNKDQGKETTSKKK